MDAFEYTSLPGRVVFGFGTIARVPDEVSALGCRRAFVLSAPHHENTAAMCLLEALGDCAVGLSSEATMHTPVEVTDRVLQQLTAAGADCLVGLGCGSITGLCKALALRTDLPQIIVPTPYAGSEATPILGQTEQGRKSTMRSPKVLPEVVVYDVELTLGLSSYLSVVSGMNAIAHAVEALYAEDANPITSAVSQQGVTAPRPAPPVIFAGPPHLPPS